MELSSSRQERQKIFMWVVLGCIAVGVGYTAWVILRANAGTAPVQAQGTIAGAEERKKMQTQPHIVYINLEEPHVYQARLVGLDPALPEPTQTKLSCGRLHYAAGNGICLMYNMSALNTTIVTLFDSDFQPRHQFTIEGILSRTRVSPDGRYAAFTVFVSGHSYNDPDMSTATVLLDTATGASLANLEEFETWKDGQRYQAPEFNFWGVTFAQDSNQFYATLRHGTTTYLVQGDIAARKLTVLHENVECPSLSPDGTRIAFKKSTGYQWQLTVLDLATMKEIPLAEIESIDDQVEWLDNERILYQKIDYDPPKWVSVFVLPADGSGKPEVFIPNATSPVVVR